MIPGLVDRMTLFLKASMSQHANFRLMRWHIKDSSGDLLCTVLSWRHRACSLCRSAEHATAC